MATRVRLTAGSGAGDGHRRDLPLLESVESEIVVDARALGPSHPMFLVRLGVFVNWYRLRGHEVTILEPEDGRMAQDLDGLDSAEAARGEEGQLRLSREGSVALRKIESDLDIENVASEAIEVLEGQAPELALWGDALHTAIGELCDNATYHGKSELGAYVAANRISEPQPMFRLAISDLGIGIPEHIRGHYPDWQDDNAAIAKALEEGVSGSGRPDRGYGLTEVLDKALAASLVRASSVAAIDIRSARGRVVESLVQGQRRAAQAPTTARRGTAITYEITTAGVRSSL